MRLVETKNPKPDTFARAWAVMHDDKTALAAVWMMLDGTFRVTYTKLGDTVPTVVQDLRDMHQVERCVAHVLNTTNIVPRVLLFN